MHPAAEEFAETKEFVEEILSDDSHREPGSNLAQATNRTMETLLNLLGKKHTIAILHQFAYGDGPLRFSDLEERIDIAPNTLSNRLKELTEVGMLTRQAYNEIPIPPRVEYESTEKARELAPVFWYLGVWTDRHDLEPIADDGSTQTIQCGDAQDDESADTEQNEPSSSQAR